MSQTALYDWFQHTLYLFHVPLFFVCSGYLYQRNSVVNNLKQWKDNILRKLLMLGVPYAAFTILSYLMKMIFQSEVNMANESGLIKTLFLEPMSPYWYLYSLFFLFLVTPTLKNKKQIIWATTIAFLIFFFQKNKAIIEIFALQGIVRWEIWFMLGILLCFYRDKIGSKWKAGGVAVLLIPMTLWGYSREFPLGLSIVYSLLGGGLGCLAVICPAFGVQRKIPEKWIIFSRKNTLPVFLMHTIFAAGVRSVLLKLGITGASVHTVFGLLASIVLPVIAAEIMRKSKWLYFWIQPDCLFKKNMRQNR